MTLVGRATGFGDAALTRTTLIGIDVGTTATKAVLIGADGQLLARYSRVHATSRPAPGYAEQNPDDWMAGVLGALTYFAGEHDLGGLAGIGFCSQVNTHVFVDRAGTRAAAGDHLAGRAVRSGCRRARWRG